MPRRFIKSKPLFTFSNRWTRSFGLEAYLPSDSLLRTSRRCIRTTWWVGQWDVRSLLGGKTHAVGQVVDKVLDFDLSDFDFTVKPVRILAGVAQVSLSVP